MNNRWFPVLGFAAGLLVSGGFAACTQDFDQFTPESSSGSGQGGATSSASSASSPSSASAGGSGVTGTGGTSSSSATASGGASSSSSASAAGGSTAQSSSSTGPMPMCGDGSVDGTEECDDGNVTPGDGCSATCTNENPDTCPGPTIPLQAGMGGMVVIQGDTTNAGNDTGATPCGGSQSGDLVYAVTPAQDGTLTAAMQGTFTTLVYARGECPGMNGQDLGCSMDQMPSTISFMVQGGQVVYIFVDGRGGTPQQGPFTLTLQLQ